MQTQFEQSLEHFEPAPETERVSAYGPAVVFHGLLLAISLIFFALHFVHLSADFPNFSRWMDWSKYTDEGWYGDAAIRFYQRGSWQVPGDFNPAVALPVWPLLEALLFRFTGVSLIAERALTVGVFGGILLSSWFLIAGDRGPLAVTTGLPRLALSNVEPWRRRLSAPFTLNSLPASLAICLLAVNPFCFVFTRLGILEPLLVLLTLITLLVVRRARVLHPQASFAQVFRANAAVIAVTGALLPLIILTKTTGVFLIPAILWLLFAAVAYKLGRFAAIALPVGAIAGGLWGLYYLCLVRPKYLNDFRYLFSANDRSGMTRDHWPAVVGWTLHGTAWIGRPLALIVAAFVLFSVVDLLGRRGKGIYAHPTIVTLMLWAAGYYAFLAYHNNLQPRYYLVVAIPLTLLVPLIGWDQILPWLEAAGSRRLGLIASMLLSLVVLIPDAAETMHMVLHPEYTFVNAARQIAVYIRRQQREDPKHSSLVLSISGSDLSLMTGIPSICDDFGTAELADRARQYNPGWDVSWNLLEDDKMDALTPAFRVQRVAAFAAMDDQDRNQLILYRLDPASAEPPARKSPHRAHPRIGQQPSLLQLKH